jgi:RNA recognition motif-containing protein
VEYSTTAEARHAIESLHDTELQGRLIMVRQDKDDGKYPAHQQYQSAPLAYATTPQQPGYSHQQAQQAYAQQQQHMMVAAAAYQQMYQGSAPNGGVPVGKYSPALLNSV